MYGIVFVDYVNQLRIGGMEKVDAIVETGKTRMRPILMTAMTTILAMSTMALGHDMGSEMGKGMSVVVIGGLVYGTLMTLFIVPAFYDIIYRKKEMKAVDIGDEETLKEDEAKLMEGIGDVKTEKDMDVQREQNTNLQPEQDVDEFSYEGTADDFAEAASDEEGEL